MQLRLKGRPMLISSNAPRTPELYFSLRPDFDYGAYMEQRSHFDRVVLCMDRNTERLVGGAKTVAATLAHGFEGLSSGLTGISANIGETNKLVSEANDILSTGFTNIEFSLDEISNNLDELRAVCEFGFSQLQQSILQSNVLLGRLLEATETPDQTWAREKFRYAKYCAENQLWEEALEYINHAINGDKSHAGFKLDPEFHFLRGQIHLGGDTISNKLVDLEKAFTDFVASVRYCRGSNHLDLRTEALSQASWCKYCSGDIDGALEWIDQVEDGKQPRPDISFRKAKYFLHRGDVASAEGPFLAALTKNPFYALRAKNDKDFTDHGQKVDAWLEALRSSKQASLLETIGVTVHYPTHAKLIGLAESKGIDVQDKKSLDIIRFFESPDDLPLFEIERLRATMKNKSRSVWAFQRQTLRSLSRALRQERSALEEPLQELRRADREFDALEDELGFGTLRRIRSYFRKSEIGRKQSKYRDLAVVAENSKKELAVLDQLELQIQGYERELNPNGPPWIVNPKKGKTDAERSVDRIQCNWCEGSGKVWDEDDSEQVVCSECHGYGWVV